jgi:hypothetical protein
MGKFDKKVNKSEPDAPNTQKKLKKKSSAHLHEMEFKGQSKEKDRNLKILGQLQKEKDYAAGGKVNAATDSDKMVRSHKKKQDKANRKK